MYAIKYLFCQTEPQIKHKCQDLLVEQPIKLERNNEMQPNHFCFLCGQDGREKRLHLEKARRNRISESTERKGYSMLLE